MFRTAGLRAVTRKRGLNDPEQNLAHNTHTKLLQPPPPVTKLLQPPPPVTKMLQPPPPRPRICQTAETGPQNGGGRPQKTARQRHYNNDVGHFRVFIFMYMYCSSSSKVHTAMLQHLYVGGEWQN